MVSRVSGRSGLSLVLASVLCAALLCAADAAALLSFCAASEPQPASPAIMVPAISRESAFLLQFLFISNLLCFIVLYVAIF